jgi:hypothetical protein
MIQVLIKKFQEGTLEKYLNNCPEGLLQTHYTCVTNALERLRLIKIELEKKGINNERKD